MTGPAATPDQNIRPVVPTGYAGNRTLWLFGGILAIAALALFLLLDARRREIEAPATTIPRTVDGTRIASPPELVIPPGILGDYAYRPDYPRFDTLPPAGTQRPVSALVSPPTIIVREVVRPTPAPADFGAVSPAPVLSSAPAVVYDARSQPARADGQPNPAAGEIDVARVRASRLINPSATVAQGTVIPAVLETALNSTRPGAVRAIVSRDVRGFDGSRVLIPRGSRLYGEYAAELQAGQNRALIRWKRLTRPDGAQIALDSPASDPLGRAGLKGRVNSNFLERFSGAIVQSALDIGVRLATREIADDTVVVALPGATQNISGAQAQQVQRTLTVRQGTSVSVFVGRDLDFSTVE